MATSRGRRKALFRFAVLVYRERTGEMDLWFARSVMTGDLGFARTGEGALSRLQEILQRSMMAAASRGLTPQEWLEAQQPDEPRWIEAWLSHWNPPHGEVVTMHPSDDCEIAAQVAWGSAA